MEVSHLNAAVLKGGEFLHASDKKERKKRASPIKKRQATLQSADNKRSRNMELFASLVFLQSVKSLISCQSSVLCT